MPPVAPADRVTMRGAVPDSGATDAVTLRGEGPEPVVKLRTYVSGLDAGTTTTHCEVGSYAIWPHMVSKLNVGTLGRLL